MSRIDELAERTNRLLLRHAELQRTNALLSQERQALLAERDALRSRLAAARTRVESLLARLPDDGRDVPAGLDGAAPGGPGPTSERASDPGTSPEAP